MPDNCETSDENVDRASLITAWAVIITMMVMIVGMVLAANVLALDGHGMTGEAANAPAHAVFRSMFG